MVKSMTGYGRAVETVNGREFTVELRSVNNRYLDCTVKLPRSLTFAEEAVKQAVKATISRGKVDVFITVRSEGAPDVKISLNAAMVEGYLTAMKQMVSDYGVQDDISVSIISRMPEVFTVEKTEVDEQQLLADLLGVVNKALTAYDAMREAEGKALENDLRSRGNTILELVSQVEAGNGQTVSDYRIRLENKLKEVLANTAIDESRILTEAAIFADKVAVDEETVRLRSHLEQMNNMLTNGGAIGRKLDVLLQEMNRESNTIGSKCYDSQQAVCGYHAAKADINQFHKLPQNIVYSIFCVCSRIFSSSALISTTIRASFTSEHLEPMVLLSRFISCSRKSSFRPTAPPVVSILFICSRWLRRRTVSSSTATLSAKMAASVRIRLSSMAVLARTSWSLLYRRVR